MQRGIFFDLWWNAFPPPVTINFIFCIRVIRVQRKQNWAFKGFSPIFELLFFTKTTNWFCFIEVSMERLLHVNVYSNKKSNIFPCFRNLVILIWQNVRCSLIDLGCQNRFSLDVQGTFLKRNLNRKPFTCIRKFKLEINDFAPRLCNIGAQVKLMCI